MANKLKKTGIQTTQTVEAWHVTQSVDAFSADDQKAYDISISGSLAVTGSTTIQGLLTATAGITHQLTSSNAISSSYAVTASYATGGTATTAATASFVTGSNVYGPHGSNSVLSSSFATTASYATGIAPGLGGEWKNETTYISSSLPIKVDGHITASGNISSSGHISSNTISVDRNSQLQLDGSGSNTYIDGNATAINIYAGGSQKFMIGSNLSLNNFGSVQFTTTDIEITGANKKISGSSTSTSSFGHYIGDGSEITGVISSSHAITASYATGIAPGLGGLWYDGTTYLSSSKDVKVTGSFIQSGSSVASMDATSVTLTGGDGLSTITAGPKIELTSNTNGIELESTSEYIDLKGKTKISQSLEITGSTTTTDNIIVNKSEGYVSADHLKSNASADGQIFYSSGGDGSLTVNETLKFDGSILALQGNQLITGSLLVSGSTTSTIDTHRLRIGEYFANGGAAVSHAEELYISASGVSRAVIESSNGSAVLQLKSKEGQSTLIDFEEGTEQRWVIGVSASNDNFVIASGSALSRGMLFQVDRTSKDVEITNNLSASAVSASTYYGDGSNLTGITSGEWKNETTYISSSLPIKVDGAITASGAISSSGNITSRDITLGHTTNYAGYVAGTTQYMFTNQSYASSGGYDLGFLIATGSTIDGTIMKISGSGGNGFVGIGLPYTTPLTKALTVEGDISASMTASAAYFVGNGSLLTDLPASSTFPFVGDAVITGSLTISGSFHAFTLDADDVVLGAGAGASLESNGVDNVLIGKNAGKNVDSGDNNVIIGAGAGDTITTGNKLILIGSGSDAASSAGNGIAIGHLSKTTSDSISIGYYAGQANAEAYAVWIGANAGVQADKAGIAIGYYAGRAISGEACIAIGKYALGGGNSVGHSNGKHNVAIGEHAIGRTGNYPISGNGNIALGHYAGHYIQTGTGNIFIGSGSLGSSALDNQLRIGHTNSGHIISGSLTTGDIIFPSTASMGKFKMSGGASDGYVLTSDAAGVGSWAAASGGGASGLWSGSADNIYTGDGTLVYVSGSQIISQSFTAGDTDSTALKVMGSGSVSGSAIFDVVGSVGSVFSVTDSLTGTLFEANNISGLPVIQAKSDNTVHLGKYGGYGITISGSTPDPSNPAARIEITGSTYFSGSIADFLQVGTVTGSFSGDGSNLTNVSATAFPFNGDAVITGSLTISGSFHSFTLDSDNIVLGQDAGIAMQSGADGNVLLGVSSGKALTTGDGNVLIGSGSGATISTNSNYTFVGNLAGRVANTSNGNAVGIGANALISLTTGIDNTAIGYSAGYYTQQWHQNVYVGNKAGRLINQAGNVAIGHKALEGKTGTGIGSAYNTAVGFQALTDINAGDYNIALGYNAGDNVEGGSQNIIIGNEVDASSASATHELKIGSGSVIPLSASLSTGDVLFPSTASMAWVNPDKFVMTTGASNGYVLTSDAAGVGTWAAASGGGSSVWYDGTTYVSSSVSAQITGSLNITGDLTAATKSFLIDHPTVEGKYLQYGVLEGPEHAVFVRGTLKDNNIITLPDHWKGLVHEDSLTVQLTAIGKPCVHYVDEIKDYEVYVGCEDGLPHCYYFIQGERKDVGKLKTELE